ncbi:MAG: VOC family protein [Pseudomonadota bacterium]
MPERGFSVRALGEIAIRTSNLSAMIKFYRDVVGLQPLTGNTSSDIVFFGLGESYGGHHAVLALFDAQAGREDLHPRGQPVRGGGNSTLHHIALSVAFDDQDAITAWYDRNNITYRVEYFDWIGWRGIFTTDPDGNTLELVAADPDHRARGQYAL